MAKMVQITKKAQKYYYDMRYQAKQWYKDCGDWNFTSTSYWGEDETLRTMEMVVIICDRELRHMDVDVRLKVRTQEEANQETALLNKVKELAQKRIEILKA